MTKIKKIGITLAVLGMGWHWVQSNRIAQDLHGKVVIVTGASSGIGAESARQFAQVGAKVVMVARRAEKLAEVQTAIQSKGGDCFVIAVDMTERANRERVISETLEHYGAIDVLVNNAGIAGGGIFEEMDSSHIERMIDLNLTSLIDLTSLALPHIRQSNIAQIVNISSVSAYLPMAGNAVYSATKSAVNNFSDSLRRELLLEGVLVSTVMPGWTKTPMLEDFDWDMMHRAGMYEPFFTVDDVSLVGQRIVETVQYRQSRVIIAGSGMWFGMISQRNYPLLFDIVFRIRYYRDAWIEVWRRF